MHVFLHGNANIGQVLVPAVNIIIYVELRTFIADCTYVYI